MTTHGSANLLDTEYKVKLKTDAKTTVYLYTVSFRMAVSHSYYCKQQNSWTILINARSKTDGKNWKHL